MTASGKRRGPRALTVGRLLKRAKEPPPKRHGSTLHVDLPLVGESTLRERAELCLRALARSEGLDACEGGAGDEPCQFPVCIAAGCDGGR